MENTNPLIEWQQIKNKSCLKFTFIGDLNEKRALNAISIWKKEFAAKSGENIILIWNCKEMTGYEPKARIHWQAALKELKSRIESIWLVTDSKIIKFGATIMSVFTPYEIKVVSSESEIII
jgi:hypothetical protein